MPLESPLEMHYYSIADAATLLGLKKNQIDLAIDAGALRVVDAFGYLRIPHSELRRFSRRRPIALI